MKKIIFIVAFVIVSLILHQVIKLGHEQYKNATLEQETHNMQEQYNAVFNELKEDTDLYFATLINKPHIKQLFAKRDRENLYKTLEDDYKKLSNRGFKVIHFHLPNNKSFLRMHKPSEFGDDLTQIRPDVARANKTKLSQYGLEVGRAVQAYRFIYPLWDGEIYLGSVEISYEMLHYLNNVDRYFGTHTHFLIEKKLFKEKNIFKDELKGFRESFEGKGFLLLMRPNTKHLFDESQLSKIFKEHKEIYNNLLEDKSFSIEVDPFHNLFDNEKHKHFIVTYLNLTNSEKKSLGYFVFYTQSEILKTLERQYLIYHIASYLLVFLLFIYLYRQMNYSSELKETVKQKTLKLRELNDSLQDRVNEQTKIIQEQLDVVKEAQKIAKVGSFEYDILTKSIKTSQEIYVILEVDGETKCDSLERFLQFILPEDRENVIARYNNGFDEKKPYSVIHRILTQNGNIKWVEDQIKFIFDEDKNIAKVIGTIQDVTALKEQESIMQHQLKMVAMGEMIGNIAHQWRQPLSIISVSATGILLKKEFDNLSDEELKEYLEDINHQAQYLSKTIDTFKNFVSKEKEFVSFYFHELILNSIELIGASLKNHYIKMELNLDDFNPMLTLPNGELEEVIINLINNAKDQFKEKEIENRKIIVTTKQVEKYAIIEIEDNAGGIPNDVLPRIFEAYFTTKHKSQGTGLGLYMSYEIVTKSLHGDIYASNTQNGARFTIKIPLG